MVLYGKLQTLTQYLIIITIYIYYKQKAVQSQLDQTILEYGCAQGCLPTISIFNDISKQLYCCSTDLCNKVPNLHKTNGK